MGIFHNLNGGIQIRPSYDAGRNEKAPHPPAWPWPSRQGTGPHRKDLFCHQWKCVRRKETCPAEWARNCGRIQKVFGPVWCFISQKKAKLIQAAKLEKNEAFPFVLSFFPRLVIMLLPKWVKHQTMFVASTNILCRLNPHCALVVCWSDHLPVMASPHSKLFKTDIGFGGIWNVFSNETGDRGSCSCSPTQQIFCLVTRCLGCLKAYPKVFLPECYHLAIKHIHGITYFHECLASYFRMLST